MGRELRHQLTKLVLADIGEIVRIAIWTAKR